VSTCYLALKIGPALLRFVPGRKARDLRNWLTVYGYWNQGGRENVEEAFAYVVQEYLTDITAAGGEEGLGGLFGSVAGALQLKEKRGGAIKPMIETPALGLYHPDLERGGVPYPTTIAAYLDWYRSSERDGSGRVVPEDAGAPVVVGPHIRFQGFGFWVRV